MSLLAEIENLKTGTFEFKKTRLQLPKDVIEDLQFILDNGVSHEDFLLLSLKKINLKAFRKEVEKVLGRRAEKQEKVAEKEPANKSKTFVEETSSDRFQSASKGNFA